MAAPSGQGLGLLQGLCRGLQALLLGALGGDLVALLDRASEGDTMSAIGIVDKRGHFECDGPGCCGLSVFKSRQQVMDCFNCKYCAKFIREGLKIIDNRGEVSLGMFMEKKRCVENER